MESFLLALLGSFTNDNGNARETSLENNTIGQLLLCNFDKAHQWT